MSDMASPAIGRGPIDHAHRSYLQKRAESRLAASQYRIELVGALGSLDWPSICASCGADTSDRLTVKKVFGRPRSNTHRARYQRQVIQSAEIPYCGTCVARHRALTPPRSLIGDMWSILWPVLIPMIGAGWFFQLTLRMMFETPSADPYSKYAWGPPAFFGAIILWCLVISWYSSRALRVEKQSEVTQACDYSDDVSWLFERERRVYALRNERFAREFSAANNTRRWSADDDRRSHWIRGATYSVAAILIIVVGVFMALARGVI